MYISGKPMTEIATELGISKDTVSDDLTIVVDQFNFEMYELTERLVLLNLGRTEKLIAAIFPKALQGDLRAIKAFTDLAKLEIEWRRDVSPPTRKEQDDDESLVIDAFERTITTGNSLYDVAIQNLNNDWKSNAGYSIDDIYASKPATDDKWKIRGTEPEDMRIAKIEEVVKKLIPEDIDEESISESGAN